MAARWPEIIRGDTVLLGEDECHLLWGDCTGYVWGQRGQALKVAMTNSKLRQTYYGALNFVSREFHMKAFEAGNGHNTVAYLQWLRQLYPGQKLLLLWDGATYHRDSQLQAFLAQVNQGLAEEDWLVTICRFAPNAPEQNPVEDVWLAGKNHLRRSFAENKTFTQVKEAFCRFLEDFSLQSVKFDWYTPQLQII